MGRLRIALLALAAMLGANMLVGEASAMPPAHGLAAAKKHVVNGAQEVRWCGPHHCWGHHHWGWRWHHPHWAAHPYWGRHTWGWRRPYAWDWGWHHPWHWHHWHHHHWGWHHRHHV